MDIGDLVKGVEKGLVRDIAIQIITGLVTSYSADALAAKTFNKNLGDKGFVDKIKKMFAAGFDDEALETLRANPSGRGKADEAITFNAFLSGLRRFQGGIYAAKADELAEFFGEDSPEKEALREQFRLTWVLLDNIQQIETLTEMALMPNDEMRMNYIRTSGALDKSIAERQMEQQNAELRAGNAVLMDQLREVRSKSLVESVFDGSIFKLF